jgi:CheY-like chemotaxis protein
MSVNALLMCRDQSTIRLVKAALEELGIEAEACVSASEAMELLVRKHYSALIVDLDLPAAVQSVRLARSADAKRRPVVFTLIGATNVMSAFQAGANFVLYKPLSMPEVVRCLRAGRGFMQSDRRRSSREKLESIIYLQFGIAALPALILDVSEIGLALQAAEPLPAIQEIPFRFVLPATDQMIEGTAELIWADDHGRAGMLFANLPAHSRKHLREWLANRNHVAIHGRSVPSRVASSRRAKPSLT